MHIVTSTYAGGVQALRKPRNSRRQPPPKGQTLPLVRAAIAAVKDFRNASTQGEAITALAPVRRMAQPGGPLGRALLGDGLWLSHASKILELVIQASSERIIGEHVDEWSCSQHRTHVYATPHGTPAIDKLDLALRDLRRTLRAR